MRGTIGPAAALTMAIAGLAGVRWYRAQLKSPGVARFHQAPTTGSTRLHWFGRWMRRWYLLLRHIYRVWRGGQLRFRLETFGLYYPALPYQVPWWRISLPAAWLLIRRAGPYAGWVEEMEVARAGGTAWWDRSVNSVGRHDRGS